MNLYPFLRRLRREAIPPILACEQEAAWPETPADPGDPIDRPSVPWRLSEQDARFLKRRLHIDPEM
jgi:hypothetical protein